MKTLITTLRSTALCIEHAALEDCDLPECLETEMKAKLLNEDGSLNHQNADILEAEGWIVGLNEKDLVVQVNATRFSVSL
ncbi:MAG: hypothetical protein IBX57_00050 [Gammaproteobacteria bacterium]|nr:hypothetical protein [Gammaproteobacteria bacterium]